MVINNVWLILCNKNEREVAPPPEYYVMVFKKLKYKHLFLHYNRMTKWEM